MSQDLLNNQKLNSKDLVYIALFIALLYVSGFIKIYILSVPFTLQTFIALCTPCFLGFKKSMIAFSVYIVAGLIGVPLFTEGGGFYYIYKPTFGYILSFLLAPVLLSKLKSKLKNKPLLLIISIFITSLIMLAFGAFYAYIILVLIMQSYSSVGFLALFFFPFIPAELLKSVCVGMIYNRLHKIIKL